MSVEYDDSASPAGSLDVERTTGRVAGPIVPPPFDGPPVWMRNIGLAMWPTDSSGFLFVRLKTTPTAFDFGL